MRAFLKVFPLVIFVLSLSIIAKPQTGEGAIAIEYGIVMQGNGMIVSVNNKGVSAFTRYTMNINLSNYHVTEPDLMQEFFSGEMTLTDPDTGKITDSTMITASLDLISYKIIITTKTGSGLLSGTFPDENLSLLPLVYQDFSKGTTGNFILSPVPPTQ